MRSTFRLLLLILGMALAVVSAGAIVQSVRELLLWNKAESLAEEGFLDLPIQFAGHQFDVRDDQPTDSTSSETEYEGEVWFVLDGAPFGPTTRAMVRRGRRDIGRYHLWVDAWRFLEHRTGEESLWLVRRLEPEAGAPARYEVTTASEDGSVQTRVLAGWQLGGSYKLFRSTQFIRTGLLSGVPLSMLDGLYFWPILVVFPVGSLVLGLYCLRVATRMKPRVAA